MNDVQRIMDLFVHRRDVYALQQSTGAYLPSVSALTAGDLAAHLRGDVSLGVYTIRPTDQTVKCVVFDLDTYDREALDFLCEAVEALVVEALDGSHPQCLLLEDSGGKGYHVWLPLSAPRSARDVRAWTHPIAEAYETRRRVMETASYGERWPALEVFPKQDAVDADGFGNLTKLPLGVHRKTGARSYFVPRSGWASDLRTLRPFPAALIPEAPAQPERKSTTAGPVTGDGAAPFACISCILTEGAGRGQRDNALYHFARYVRASGLPEDLALEWCERVNDGFTPPLTPVEVRTKVRSAYAAKRANPGCSDDWLRDYCPGGPNCWAPWNDRGQRSNEDDSGGEPSYPWLLPPAERMKLRRSE